VSRVSFGGYRIERVEPLEHLRGRYFELTHLPTGARHIHIACDDQNNSFAVLFPTVPTDSTGIAHILEHVVLAGSRRYPVRDPFFSMIPRSLSTFMNAMTSSDSTIYPFSTRNTKDFFNLLQVYLDATFFPLLSEEAFKQEGHRLEFERFDDPSSGLRFKGVVFNEMKAHMATAQHAMHESIGRALFPDLTYAQQSGGDPEKMPDLTWQQLGEFHAVHYHPSNAYFYTYGNLPMEAILEQIEKGALARLDRIEVELAIPDQKRFDGPREFHTGYPLPRNEDPNRKSQVLIGWLTTHVGDSFEVFSIKVLEEVLLANAASPLRKALVDSGFGNALADGTGFHRSYQEAPFCAGLKGIDPDAAGQVEAVVLQTLERLVKEGVDPQLVDAAIHQLEISQREVSNAGFPYSLRVYFQLAGAYHYGGDPYRSLRFDEDLGRLEQERRSGSYFESLIRRWFLDNPHRVRIVLTPDQELDENRTRAELARLSEIEGSFSETEKRALVDEAKRLKQLQEAEQDLSALPTLELSDVPMKFEDVPHQIEQIGGARVGFFPQPTNGISYIDIRADFSGIPDELKDYLGLFANAVPRMGAGSDDYLKMAARIEAYTGGIYAGAGVRPLAGREGFRQSFSLSGKALARNHQPFVEILKDFLSAVYFEPKRLKEVLAELRVQKEASVVPGGNAYARMLAASKLGPIGRFEERLSGLTQLKLLKELARLEEGELEGVIANLTAIRDRLFSRGALQICVTTEEEHLDELRRLLEELLKAIPSVPHAPSGEPIPRSPEGTAGDWSDAALTPMNKHEARTTAVPVAYNVKVFPTVGFTNPDAPPLMVLSNFLRTTFLHREVREKGGAYGARASFDRESGYLTFSSYRDPQIARTYQAFDEAVNQVLKEDLDAEEVKEAILSSCRDVDPLLSPDTKGRRRFFDDLAGYTLELQSKFKRGLLETTSQDLKRVAATYLRDKQAALATIGDPAKVEEANRAMGGIFEVSPV